MKSLDPNRPNVTRWGYKVLEPGVLMRWDGGGTIPIANRIGLSIFIQYLDVPEPEVILFRCPHGAWKAALRDNFVQWQPLWTFIDLFQGPPEEWTEREKVFHYMLVKEGHGIIFRLHKEEQDDAE